jgi:hypothetical protein
LTAALGKVGGTGPQIDAFASLAQASSSTTALAAVARDPVRNYLKGMQARLQGKAALATELLAKALEEHGDACRAAGEYLAASRELGRVLDDNALGWLRRENAQCVNLPERSTDKPTPRRGPARITH